MHVIHLYYIHKFRNNKEKLNLHKKFWLKNKLSSFRDFIVKTFRIQESNYKYSKLWFCSFFIVFAQLFVISLFISTFIWRWKEEEKGDEFSKSCNLFLSLVKDLKS